MRIASLIVLALALSFARGLAAWAGTSPTPIVGGTEARPGDWPDVVAVLGADGGLCSGTLLAADLVLTAAHCIEMDPVEVIVGAVDLARPDGDRRSVKWSRAYPSWIERYDVGVVMLDHPVLAKQRAVAQGCTAQQQFAAGLEVHIVGFGLTTAAGTGDNTRLHQATVPLVDATCTTDPACAPAVAPGGEFTAGGRGADTCFGDSGGPVYVDTAHGPALIGVVSRGLATAGDPCEAGGVYVRADKVVAWVQSVTGRTVDRVPCELPGDDGAGTADDGTDTGGDETATADEPEPAGCNAAGPVGGGFALYYAALVVLGLRRSRARRRT